MSRYAVFYVWCPALGDIEDEAEDVVAPTAYIAARWFAEERETS